MKPLPHSICTGEECQHCVLAGFNQVASKIDRVAKDASAEVEVIRGGILVLLQAGTVDQLIHKGTHYANLKTKYTPSIENQKLFSACPQRCYPPDLFLPHFQGPDME